MDNNSNHHQKKLKIFLATLFILTVIAFLYWFFLVRGREFTDDAYVHADIARVSARIPGNIEKIFIDNDDFVNQGDLLLTLDDKELNLQKQRLLAIKEQINSELQAEKINLEMIDKSTLADLENAKANLKRAIYLQEQTSKELEALKKEKEELDIIYKQAKKDLERYKSLIEKNLISRREYEEKENTFSIYRAKIIAIENKISAYKKVYEQTTAQIRSAKSLLNKNRALLLTSEQIKLKIKTLEAKLKEIEAQIKTTDLNLSYTQIKAPISGYIAQKNIQIGDRVQIGEPLLAIVPLDKVYVEANFKETQLKNMYIGQKAIIKPDIYPELKLEGRVAGIRAGTGSVFSLLPPENAVGNWIKVVQRVPVKIVFTTPIPEEYPLRVGLSLEVTVFTSEKTGPRLKEKLSASQSK